jgi:hypothetical protein
MKDLYLLDKEATFLQTHLLTNGAVVMVSFDNMSLFCGHLGSFLMSRADCRTTSPRAHTTFSTPNSRQQSFI